MRKLSCKWPMYLTLFVFLPPIYYVWLRIGNPEIFNEEKFVDKVLGGLGLTIIIWLVYGVTCLLARQPNKPIEGKQNDTPIDK
jgi:uncharacterized membrane protein